MYNIKKDERVYLVNKDGSVKEYRNWNVFRTTVSRSFIENNVGDNFKTKNPNWLNLFWLVGKRDCYYFHWVVKNVDGDVIPKRKILESMKIRKNSIQSWSSYKTHTITYRVDPVPGTRNRKHCKYYRHQKTTQERRWYYAYPEFVRGERKAHRLDPWNQDMEKPKAWDHYNWKNYRKTQWKREAISFRKLNNLCYPVETVEIQ